MKTLTTQQLQEALSIQDLTNTPGHCINLMLSQIEIGLKKFRTVKLRFWTIMEDRSSTIIQETGQDQRPAMMVGYSSLDSAATGMEAGSDLSYSQMRRRGER